MGAIVSSQLSRHDRPASARLQRPEQTGGEADDRPTSAPPSLILSTERSVDVARRREALARVDDLRAEQTAQQSRPLRAISPEQEMQLERMVGEALVDQVLYEGEGVLTSISSNDAATVLESVQSGGGPLSSMLRLQALSHGIEISTARTPSLSRSRSSMPSTSRSAASEDEDAERQRARGLKRTSVAEVRETRVRMQSGRSDASDPEERQLEEALVLSDVQEKERNAKERISADVLAHFARDRSTGVNKAKQVLLAKVRKTSSAERDIEADAPDQTLDAASSAPSLSSRQPLDVDLWELSSPRAQLDPLTPAELEEADAMVADILQEATDLMSQLPEQHMQGVLDDVHSGRSPEHSALREHTRMEDLAACEDTLDDILREGERLLQRLPDDDARALLQVIEYTPRTDSQSDPHPHSSNSNAVVCALRAHARQVEDDALLEAESLLASESLVDSILDAAVVSDNIGAILAEGQALLDQLPNAAAKQVLEDIHRSTSPVAGLLRGARASPDVLHMSLELGALVPYGEDGKEAAEGLEEGLREQPEAMSSGRAALMEMLEESDKLLGALPSPHARNLLHVLETSETPLSGAIRCPRAAAAAFEAAAAMRKNQEEGAEFIGSEEIRVAGAAADAEHTLDDGSSPEQSAGIEEMPAQEQEAARDTVARDGVGRIVILDGLARLECVVCEGQLPPVSLVVDAMGRPVLEDGSERRFLADDGLSLRWLCGKVSWRDAAAKLDVEANLMYDEESARPSTVDSWAQANPDLLNRATQHVLVSEDAGTQVWRLSSCMWRGAARARRQGLDLDARRLCRLTPVSRQQVPSRPTSAQLEREWHLISVAEVEEALEAEADAIIAEVCESLVTGVEERDAMEASVEAGEALRADVGERKVVSARTHRDDPVFVKEYNGKKAEEARVVAEQMAAAEKEEQWAAEREALEAELARREQEVMELRSYLDKLPVVKVTETVDRTTGKLVDDPKYEYSRIPLEEEMAVHLQEEAERAFQRTMEAEIAAEQARRAAAEEAFRFEAAKAEVRLEAFRLQQRLEAEQQRAEREGEAADSIDPKRGAEPELKEGWVSVKRDGASGGLQRRMYVLRNTAILSFADETRRGGCLNAMGLERIDCFCKGQGSTLEIHPRDGNPIILHCGGLQARDQWLIAFENALKSFRSRYVAQVDMPSPASKAKRELSKESWDSAIEEKLRREVEARRDAVSKARMEQARADKLLDDARAQHQRLDRELRLRNRYPDISDDFIACLPTPEDRRQVGMVDGSGGGGGGGVSMKDMENAIAAAKKKAEDEHRRAIQQVQDTWQRKVKETEKKVFELDKELMSYKEMSFKDTGITDLEDMYGGDNVKDQAAADAANFGGTLYGDGMMVVPQDWERLGTAGTKNSLEGSRPVTSLGDGNIHVFVDGDQAVLLNTSAQGTTATALGGEAGEEEVGRAEKEGLV